MHPVLASTEYTYPMSVPTKTRPETIVGWPYAESPVGYPNAHFNFNCGTSSAVRPAPFASWNRELTISGLHPFHSGPEEGSASGAFAAQWFGMSFASPAF